MPRVLVEVMGRKATAKIFKGRTMEKAFRPCLDGIALLIVTFCFPPLAWSQVTARPDKFGDAMQYLLPIAAASLSVYQGDYEGLKQFGLTAALSQGATELLKHTVRSNRPDGTGLGFPSGHTSIAFASATYVYERYSWEWSAPMFGLAAATGYSRVHTHHHFTKDVVGGAAIGMGSAVLLTHPLGEHAHAMVSGNADSLYVNLAMQW